MGLDEKSKGVCIYWPDTRTVGVECNIYVDKTGASASHLEGEEWDGFVKTNTDTLFTAENPPSTSTNPPDPDDAQKSDDPTPIDSSQLEILSDIDETPSEPDLRPKQNRKLTKHLQDLISGEAVSDYRPKLGRKIATEIQLPTENPPEPDEQAQASYEGGKFGMAADFIDEYCMVA